MAKNGPESDPLRNLAAGMTLVLAEIRDANRRSDERFERLFKVLEKDRKQAAEDRKQAAKDRQEAKKDRKLFLAALSGIGVIGKELRQGQKEMIKEFRQSQKNIIKALRDGANGRNGNGPRRRQ